MCMLHGMYHAYTMHTSGSDSVTLETSGPTATAGAWEWRLVMQCAASLPDVEAEAHPPSGSALLARVRVSSRDSAAQVPPMLLRLDLPKLVIALGTEGVDAAVTAAAAATTAAGAAGRAAWRGCSRLQEGTLLRVSLQAARHRLALYDRARGWEACSVGRLSAEVLYICITRCTCSLVITPPCSPPRPGHLIISPPGARAERPHPRAARLASRVPPPPRQGERHRAGGRGRRCTVERAAAGLA